MKLHLGCGTRILDGYCNIDVYVPKNLEGVIKKDNAMTLNVYYHNEIEEIISFHMFEHLPRPCGQTPNALTALVRWFNILKPGGKLVIECPNFDEVVKEYLAGNSKRKDNIFGLNRHDGDTHQWGYGPDDIKDWLEIVGFVNITVTPGTDYHTRFEPCMRVVAFKPEK